MDDTPIPTLADRIRAIPIPKSVSVSAVFAFHDGLRAAAALVEVEAAKTPIGSADSVESTGVPLPLDSEPGAAARGASCFDNGCEQCISPSVSADGAGSRTAG